MSQTGTTPTTPQSHFQRPGLIERWFNRVVTWIVAIGGGFRHNYVLEVPGRRTGKVYRTPVNLMEHEGRRYLVAPRGRTAWVRNAEAAGSVTLQRGKRRVEATLDTIPVEQRAPLLREYLGRYAASVKGFFTVAPGASLTEFEQVASRHPVFEVHSA